MFGLRITTQSLQLFGLITVLVSLVSVKSSLPLLGRGSGDFVLLVKTENLVFRRSHAHWNSIVLRAILDLPDLLDLQDIMVLRALVDRPVTMVPRDYLDLEPVPVFTRLHPARV